VQVNLERVGYRVMTAFDGREALEQIAVKRPDLVICDVMMPYMDGFELLRVLRKAPSTRDLKFMMLTARAMDTDLFEGWKSGVDCYLTKPFSPLELLSAVRRIFDDDDSPGGTPASIPVTPRTF
jgi:two-component system alkaline phosphatase synthesis response regulator PhoP/two-component system response regulator VicR